MGGWGGFLDKLIGRFPKRIESIKNEISKLEAERAEILIHKAEVSKAKRLEFIQLRLAQLNARLSNATSD